MKLNKLIIIKYNNQIKMTSQHKYDFARMTLVFLVKIENYI